MALTPREAGGSGPYGHHLLLRAQRFQRLPSAHSMQSGQLPSLGTCLLTTQAPWLLLQLDLWSLCGGWRSQEGSTMADWGWGIALRAAKKEQPASPGPT